MQNSINAVPLGTHGGTGDINSKENSDTRRTRDRCGVISLISQHNFEREIFATALGQVFPDSVIQCFENAQEWETGKSEDAAEEIVLYNFGDRLVSDEDTKEDLRKFVELAGERRVIVTSRNDDMMAVFDAIDCGAISYISSDVGFDDLVEAMGISSLNSVVIPRRSMLALRGALPAMKTAQPGLERHFTERQLSVAKALRRGDANKTIAYELGLCESTVKVHIRTIMRKLKATNRTQAAYRLNELANGGSCIEVAKND